MAALLPPPKRQKVYHGIPEPENPPIEKSPNVIVQFVSEEDGSALAPAVSLPADISRDDLQGLVNNLTCKVCSISCSNLNSFDPECDAKADEPVPFQFHAVLPANVVNTESTRIVISKSIEADVLSHPSHAFSPEDILVVHCSPQSVFRVRPATRCSSSLSGEVFFGSPRVSVPDTPYVSFQDTRRLYYAHLFLLRGTSLQQAQETLMHACGICSPKPLHTHCPATRGGSYASSGRPSNESWLREDMTAM
jgi:NLE (NUC135) domain